MLPDSPIHTAGYGILIVINNVYTGAKMYIIADCQMNGGIAYGMV